ncbi:hypothetical protein CONLIGDRAFT_708920 [Coniochaeta ligniaria NRRL 30616]|uniref:Ubiquitin-like domain-containing protein n=1 Tax=Coniochaeta ligniaria NRRL 30616 TaxID=1408157 RepID=A0A1J7IEA0_9PEZI|nr:hypothetical protein CONLIGDRAFT_708920 [Coniochaeta ligniaria NRRL 30616]
MMATTRSSSPPGLDTATSSSSSDSCDDEFVRVQEAGVAHSTAIRPVTSSNTVRELKEALAAEIGLGAWEELNLYFAETSLKDNDATLESFNVANGDELTYCRSVTPKREGSGPMFKTLFFTNMISGGNFSLTNVPTTWTVAALMQRIAQERGYQAETLRLLFAKKELQSDNTLASYGLRNESDIFIVSRVRGG